jgi:hypothetical protein
MTSHQGNKKSYFPPFALNKTFDWLLNFDEPSKLSPRF